MRISGLLVDGLCVMGLALPGVTVYRLWPDFIYLYAGAGLLALVAAGWFLARMSPNDS
jgi:hypothetical protein